MIKLNILIQDLQRQVNRIRGEMALHFGLIAEALKDLRKMEERLQNLEKKEEETK